MRGYLPLLSCLLAFPTSASAFCQLTTESPISGDECAGRGLPLVWRRQCLSFSLTDSLGPDGPPLAEVRQVAEVSFTAWTDFACETGPVPLEVRQTAELGACLVPEYNPSGRNANSVIFADNWRELELPPSALGLTELWHDPETGEMYDADMRINMTRGQATLCSGSCPPGGFDIQNVLTHEAGHFFGLGHSAVVGSTMASRATAGEIEKRTLEADDREGICSIYGELLPPQCEDRDFAPDNGFAAACGVPAPAASHSSGCAVGSPSPSRAGGAGAVVAAVLLGLGLSRRLAR